MTSLVSKYFLWPPNVYTYNYNCTTTLFEATVLLHNDTLHLLPRSPINRYTKTDKAETRRREICGGVLDCTPSLIGFASVAGFIRFGAVWYLEA